MADDYLRRTAITRPILTDEQQDLLDATISGWKDACNISSRIGWDAGETRKTSLQDLAYDTVLEETRLGSQHAILATHQAAAALDGVEAIENLDEHYKTSRLEFTSNTVKYDTRTMTLFDDGSVSLSTVDGRIRCDLNLPDEDDGYQYEYLTDDEWELTESTLSWRDGEYSLHLGFRKDKPDKQVEIQGDDEDRTGQFSALTSASSTSPPPARRTLHQGEKLGIDTGSSSRFAATSSRPGHNPPIGRFSR